MIDVEDDLVSARSLVGDERDQVVADLAETLDGLRGTVARLRRPVTSATPERQSAESVAGHEVEPAEVELQASWTSGQVVVWASGRGATPETHDDLSTRLEAVGGPPLGWQLYPGIHLPGGMRADALAIPMKDALGWLVAVGGGHGRSGVGAGVLWLGHVALEGVRLAASGSIVPALRVSQRPAEWTGRRRGPVASGARGQPGDHRACRGDAGDGGRGGRRPWPGGDVCGDRRGGRCDRYRERRADGATGPSIDGEFDDGRTRRVDRPYGRLTVPSPRRARRSRVENTRPLDAYRHITVTSAARRATRRAWSRWGLARLGPRTIGQGSDCPDRRSAAGRTRQPTGGRRVGATRTAPPRPQPFGCAASRAGRAESGRGVGVDDRCRPRPRRRRVRRAGTGAVATQGDSVAATVRRGTGRLGGGSAPAQQRRLVGALRRRRAHRCRGRSARPAGPPARAVPSSGLGRD